MPPGGSERVTAGAPVASCTASMDARVTAGTSERASAQFPAEALRGSRRRPSRSPRPRPPKRRVENAAPMSIGPAPPTTSSARPPPLQGSSPMLAIGHQKAHVQRMVARRKVNGRQVCDMLGMMRGCRAIGNMPFGSPWRWMRATFMGPALVANSGKRRVFEQAAFSSEWRQVKTDGNERGFARSHRVRLP